MEGEAESYVQDQALSDHTEAAIETFFASSRFSRNPQEFKRNSRQHKALNSGNQANRRRWYQSSGQSSGKSFASSQVVCFNCGNSGCSVTKCTQLRDLVRIQNNLSRWRELRKVEYQAKINLSRVSSVSYCASEAQDFLAAVTYVNK